MSATEELVCGELEDIQRRLSVVRDKLATVAAEAGPLFREVGDLSDILGALLERAKASAASAEQEAEEC